MIIFVEEQLNDSDSALTFLTSRNLSATSNIRVLPVFLLLVPTEKNYYFKCPK